MLVWPSEMGTWTINSLSMIWAGAKPLNLELLWSAAPWEDENLEMPGVAGSLPRDPVAVQQVHVLRYALSGLVMADGSVAADPLAGFRSNYGQLQTRAGTPATWGASTITSTIAKGSTSRTAAIQPFLQQFPDGARGSVIEVDLRVVIPAGAFT